MDRTNELSDELPKKIQSRSRAKKKRDSTEKIANIRGGRFTLSLIGVSLRRERKYIEQLRDIKLKVKRSDRNKYPQVPDSYFFRLSIAKERYHTLFRVSLGDVCQILSASEMNKGDNVHVFSYWQPNYDTTRLEIFHRINHYTQQHTKKESLMMALWDLNAISMVLHHTEDLKLSEIFKTGKRRSYSKSGIIHPRAYLGSLQTENRRNIVLIPFELHEAQQSIIDWRNEKAREIEFEMSRNSKDVEIKLKVFADENKEWIDEAYSNKRKLGDRLNIPEHEYQLESHLSNQTPLSLDLLYNNFSPIPPWVGYGAYIVRALKKNSIRWDGRLPSTITPSGDTRPIRISPSSMQSRPHTSHISYPIIDGSMPTLHLSPPSSKPGSIDSNGPDTCTVSTATTTPGSFMHDWRYTATHTDYDHRLSAGPPKGCETSVNLEWRMRVNAEKIRRMNALLDDGLIAKDDFRFSTSSFGINYRSMHRRDQEYRKTLPNHFSRIIHSFDSVNETKKEIAIKKKLGQLELIPENKKTEFDRTEAKVLHYAINEIERRREATKYYTIVEERSTISETGLMIKGMVHHNSLSTNFSKLPQQSLINRISITPSIRTLAEAGRIPQKKMEELAQIIDVRRNLLCTLSSPLMPSIGWIRKKTWRDIINEGSILDHNIYFLVCIVVLFLLIKVSY